MDSRVPGAKVYFSEIKVICAYLLYFIILIDFFLKHILLGLYYMVYLIEVILKSEFPFKEPFFITTFNMRMMRER